LETIDLETWEAFGEELTSRNIPFGEGPRYLFRGQSNASWSLDTTLERSWKKKLLFSDYYKTISVIRPQIESFTNRQWGELPGVMKIMDLEREYDAFSLMLSGIGNPFPAYNYMAHLRHHGFPSPLLDWTRTPYVAAYFAFRNAVKDRVAIYLYSERPQNFKSSSSDEPQIHLLGPYVQTHRRHFLQQSTYTICLRFQIDAGWHFSPHESVFSLNVTHQDALWKFTIPASERVKVLKTLDAYNLNAFSLFDSEEALMETMAMRHIGFKQALVEADANALKGER